MTKIFHFTKLNTAIEFILPKKQLRTNSLKYMNDPKESQPWAFGGIDIDYKTCYPETYSYKTHIDHQYYLGNDIKSCVQLICFVKDEPEKGFLNEIMWAHYADNHHGICLELDQEVFIQENKEQLDQHVFEPVAYGQHEKPYISWEKHLNKEENIGNIIKSHYKNLFLRKSKYWEHENEQRLIIFTKNQKYLKVEKSLTGIYLGLEICHQYLPSLIRNVNMQQTKLYDLYYEGNKIKNFERDIGDFRPLITEKFKNGN